eukprot:Seg779.3 transcript_id=Seg779.3/GoldUCD/mRNA.D3Y31 product=Caprin-1 protein_id=Seg779.3/GoldUCD/D3Y31
MPSASSKTASMSNQVPSIEGQDPLRVVVSMMEKKVRNLEKRKGKLVLYTQQVQEGKELVEREQQDAVKKLEFVENNLELAKEFHQIFRLMEQEHVKIQKKEQKRANIQMKEKSNEERKHLVVQVLEVQSLLENLDEDVKQDFLSGTNGAVKLTEDDLTKLDEIYKLITPSQNEDPASTAAEHLQNLLDEKEKPVLGSTYKEISGIIKKIKDCKYFEKTDKEEVPTEEAEQQATEAQVTETAEVTEAVPAEVAEENAGSAEEETEIVTSEEGVRGADVYTAVPSDHPEPELTTEGTLEEPLPTVNGVDLPSEFSEAVADSALNFMGESEVETRLPAAVEEGKLNAASPEFIPRSQQGPGQPPSTMQPEGDSGWEETDPSVNVDPSLDNSGWQEVPSSSDPHQQYGRPRGGPRGRDRGGFRGGREGGRGGRGRGGYGQNGSNYYRQERSDNYRRDGTRGGPRGNPRGGRGGPRGAPRGAPRGGNGGFGRPQPQQ